MRLYSLLVGLWLAVGASVVVPAQAGAAPADGAVLSTSALAAADLPSGAARGVRLLYATRDQNGRPARSTGAVYFPRGAAPRGGWPVISWAHGTTGIAPQCAPSLMTGRVQDRDQPLIAAALRHGYVVAATDYAGAGAEAEYLGGRAAAHDVIDVVRAARDVDSGVGRRWVAVGHSQGGHAALWATRLAPRYAPDLDVRGVVALAPYSQVSKIFSTIQRPGVPNLSVLNSYYGFALYLMSGLAHARPDVNPLGYLTPTGKRWLTTARTVCAGELANAMTTVAPGTFYRTPVDGTAFVRALRDYADIPTTGWRRPILIQQGVLDPVIPAIGTQTLVDELRGGGAAVTMRTYPTDHGGVVPMAMGDTLAAVAGYFR
ncbi:alpha/beta hydrolase [Gordonia sp. X0973]|uniref:alpha/beta hydrolase family protein n=1 Tax=Gordonia sp. X0973 TaxID=2742602 RepID=UPI000F52EA0C|nr:lipase family protein [Gordonia sp. X0973]QKT08190.1 alpha/beta hydrolase [Gordonia sp. X0973]